MDNESTKYSRLVKLLKELFQLDQPELDFGLYRIMHAKSAEITQFLDHDLLPQVKQAFSLFKSADSAELHKNLATAIERAHSLGADPETLPRVKELRGKLANEAVDLGALENEVYDHLFRFLRRYYSEGDFLAKRVYKPGVYAIPYEGEEVTMYWANSDQYYIKTNEYLRDYTFRLRPNDDKDPMRVHLRLADAAEGEHGNFKPVDGKDRSFVLASESFVAQENSELTIRFEYRPPTLSDWPTDMAEGKQKPPSPRELVEIAVKRVLSLTEGSLLFWLKELARPQVSVTGESLGHSRLEAHLNRYVAKNTFDYFIHKDLGEFLRRELDFYIKNEVMYLDDVQNESAPRVEQYLSKIKVIRSVAGKLIAFLSQLEDFQKKLWLKTKFAIETRYCIKLGHISEKFYQTIAANDGQREEWIRLFAIDEITANLSTPAYSAPLTVEFLRANPTLVVDTKHFGPAFIAEWLESVNDLSKETDGVLIHSENFQALNLLKRSFRKQIDCIYIDPPYNTGDSQIPYKNEYLRSSWLSLMDNRLELATGLLTDDSVLFIAIDDFEMVNLAKLIDVQYPLLRREMIIINHHPQGGKAKTLAHTHEYMLACLSPASDRTLAGRTSEAGVEYRPFKRSGTAESNFRYGRPNSFYAILLNPKDNRILGLEPPPNGPKYPLGPTEEGYIRVYPIGSNGQERVWRRSYESGAQLIAQNKLECSDKGTIYQLLEAHERTAALFSNWVDPRYNAGTFGANLLRDIIGAQNLFSYPKSIHTVGDAIFSAGLEDTVWVLDYFGGSGTTAHAIINLNREDGGQRRFILVEGASYFDSVLLPRIKKISFAPEWKEGKPKRSPTSEEAERSPRIIKVLRLESYEDALNNLQTKRTPVQQSLLNEGAASGPDGLKEQYLLRYMLDVETKGSQSLLNVQAFEDPTAYRLKIKPAGCDESKVNTIDLLETFNWLIGITVQHIAAPQSFTAEFERDAEKRLRLNGKLKQDDSGPWWFRRVEGLTPDGRKTLVIWRKLTGDPEADNLVLDVWMKDRLKISTKDFEFDLIYVNGGNNLENLKLPDDTWKVRLIEDDFHRLMFDTENL